MFDIFPRQGIGAESCKLKGTSRSPVIQDIARSQTRWSRWFRAMFSWILKISWPPEVLVSVFEHPHDKKFLKSSMYNFLLEPLFLVSNLSTVNIQRKSDPVFNMASQQRVVLRLIISSPLSVLWIGQVHLSQSLISYYSPPSDLWVSSWCTTQHHCISCTEKSKIKHTTPEGVSQMREMLNSSQPSFSDHSLSGT